jgi:hypothetical protein
LISTCRSFSFIDTGTWTRLDDDASLGFGLIFYLDPFLGEYRSYVPLTRSDSFTNLSLRRSIENIYDFAIGRRLDTGLRWFTRGSRFTWTLQVEVEVDILFWDLAGTYWAGYVF